MYLMDEALSQMHAEGRAQTVLTVFDLRGFGCVAVARALLCSRLLTSWHAAQHLECRHSIHSLLYQVRRAAVVPSVT